MKKLALALGFATFCVSSSFALEIPWFLSNYDREPLVMEDEPLPEEGEVYGVLKGAGFFGKAKVAMGLPCTVEEHASLIIRYRATAFILRNLTDASCYLSYEDGKPVYIVSGCGEGVFFGRRFAEPGTACWMFKDGGRKNDYGEFTVWDNNGEVGAEEASTFRLGELKFVEEDMEQMYY